jgi:ketosteroid isomerase-like protein
MYAGGRVEPVLELLDPEIVWHVPGANPIAGDHRGHDEVARYFERRRGLAGATMRMHPRTVVCEGDGVAQFVEGTAEVDGEDVRWQTVGVYRVDVERGLVCEVWLVPLDSGTFDRIWS